MPLTLTLSATARRAFERMAGDLQRLLGDRFVALVASGPHSGVAFAASIDPGILEALGPLTHNWHVEGLDTPLLLTPTEFRRSLDTFPLEYGAIVDRHLVIAGTPPFDGVRIDPRHVRRACEVLAKSHLIHLRQGWMDANGHDDALARLLVESAGPLQALLSHVARLHADGFHVDRMHDDPALAGARLAAIDVELTREILALDAAPERSHGLVRRMPDYLAAAEQLWSFVDRWEL